MGDFGSGFCKQCAMAILALVATPFAFASARTVSVTFNLGVIDWTSIGALASAAAAFGAFYAAKAALMIDALNAQRTRTREKQAALPVGHALYYECIKLTRRCEAAVAATPGDQKAQAYTRFGAAATVPLLERCLLSLGMFDVSTSDALGKVYVVARAVEHMLTLAPPPDAPNEDKMKFYDLIDSQIEVVARESRNAVVALAPYLGKSITRG